jgi:cytochrome c-type biogenesis protein CcmH/NrfF
VHQKIGGQPVASQIMDYLVARYGAEILMTTPKQSGTMILRPIPHLAVGYSVLGQTPA